MLIRKIKTRRAAKKRARHLQKVILHEMVEVQATICRYLEHEGRRAHNPMTQVLGAQFHSLKDLSGLLRDELLKEEGETDATLQ